MTKTPHSRATVWQRTQNRKLFDMEGVALEFRDQDLQAIAERFVEKKTGARVLRSILEKALLDIMYELPSLSHVSKVIIDEATIHGETKPIIIYENHEQQSSAAE